MNLPLTLEEAPLQVSTKLLSSEESLSILKIDLTSKGYQPIEVTITNSGSHTYEISRASTSLPCVAAEEIAWKETRRSIPRAVGLKVLGFFFWPLIAPGIIDSIHTIKKHHIIADNLRAKGFKDSAEQVLPYSIIKRVLYIPKAQFTKKFTVALEDLTEDELVVVPVSVS